MSSIESLLCLRPFNRLFAEIFADLQRSHCWYVFVVVVVIIGWIKCVQIKKNSLSFLQFFSFCNFYQKNEWAVKCKCSQLNRIGTENRKKQMVEWRWRIVKKNIQMPTNKEEWFEIAVMQLSKLFKRMSTKWEREITWKIFEISSC